MSSQRKTRNHRNKIENKKAAVLGNQEKKGFPIVLLLLVGCLVLGGAAAYIALVKPDAGPVAASVATARNAEPSEVNFPLSQFDDGQARHFDYRTGSLTVRYFILKSSDGVVRAAFDACDVCWPSGKGYYQDGDAMVCRNCGRRFSSVLINEVKGGCNPAPLLRSVQGDRLIIKVDDILQGKQYFNFSGKA